MTDDNRFIGTRVLDSDDDDPDPARVVNTPDRTADEWHAVADLTVSEHPSNHAYPNDAPVVVVCYEDELREAGILPDWSGDEPLKLADLAEEGVRYYSFPAQRLEVAETQGGVEA